jgi:hypothetical protein
MICPNDRGKCHVNVQVFSFPSSLPAIFFFLETAIAFLLVLEAGFGLRLVRRGADDVVATDMMVSSPSNEQVMLVAADPGLPLLRLFFKSRIF